MSNLQKSWKNSTVSIFISPPWLHHERFITPVLSSRPPPLAGRLGLMHASKEMLKILQATSRQSVNRELPDVQAGFRKAEEPDTQLPTSAES